ncbi:MAG TPA: hypothetical protein VHW23_09305 [Kofleriaceae bacterium]|jgi:hypothetical protein|nr:hypothetical protein [Kofleriaceae bacterium]
MSSRRLTFAALVVAALGSGGVAAADMSRGVIAAFKGDLVVTKTDLPEGKNDKDTIAKIKAERLKEITGEAKSDVTGWVFHYTAFLSKTGATELTMEFWNPDKKLAANKHINGIDPKTPALSGEIQIDEDEGLSKGTAYTVKLVTDKNAVVAQTPLVMK